MTPEVQDQTEAKVGYFPDEGGWSDDEIRQFVSATKKDKIPQNEIYDYLNKENAFAGYETYGAENGIPEKQIRQYISKEYQIDTRKKPNLFQSALESMMGVIPMIPGLEETKAIPGKIIAGTIGAADAFLNFPEKLAKSQMKHNHPEMSDEQINKTYSEVKEAVSLGIPDVWESIKDTVGQFLPSIEKAEEYTVGETSQPESAVGKYLGNIATGVGAGGPIGAVGAAVDPALEALGFSPYQRAAAPLFAARAPQQAINPSEILPANPNVPPTKPWKNSNINKTRRKAIDSVSELATKIALRDPEKVNYQTLSDLKQLGFEISEVPIQAYTEGGMANLIEGAQENSMMGSKKYNDLVGNFTKDMTTRAENILDGLPIEAVEEAVTEQSLGATAYDNPVRNTFIQLAPSLNLTRQEVGSIGTGTINAIDEGMASQARGLYDQSRFNDTQVITPAEPDYSALERVIDHTERLFQGEGYIGETYQSALGILNDMKNLFKPKKIPDSKILGPTGEKLPTKQQKPNIKYDDLRKNLIALNDKVNYEKASAINLLEPVNRELRSIFRRRSVNEPALVPFVQAQEVFSERARLLGDPTLRRLYNMTDEQFFNAMRKPSNLQAFHDFAVATDNIAPYDSLRGALIIKDLRPAFEATTPSELAKNISNSTIEKFRDLQPFYPEYPGLADGLREAREIARNKTSLDVTQGKIRQDAIQFQLDGGVPSKTLSMMDTPKGIDLVEKTLSTSEQGRKIYKAFARKKVEQIIYGKTKKTEISIKDLSKVIKDLESKQILKRLLPERNFRELEALIRVADSLEKGVQSGKKMKHNLERSFLTGSGISSYMVASGLGAIPGAALGGTAIALNQFSKAILSPNFRKAMIERAESIKPPLRQTPRPKNNK